MEFEILNCLFQSTTYHWTFPFLVDDLCLFQVIEYFPIVFLLILSICIIGLILLLAFLLSPHNPDVEKLNPYECGFEPFTDGRLNMNIHFYLVAILFLIFDLEAILLYPFTLSLNTDGFLNGSNDIKLYVVGDFLIELGAGFIYIWRMRALNWE